MGDRDDHDEDGLLAGFRALEARRPQPSQALTARVLAGAEAEMRRRSGQRRDGAMGHAGTPRWWRRAADLLGGAQGIAGLASAMLAGLWIGIAPPAPVSALEEALLGTIVVVELGDGDLVFDAQE